MLHHKSHYPCHQARISRGCGSSASNSVDRSSHIRLCSQDGLPQACQQLIPGLILHLVKLTTISTDHFNLFHIISHLCTIYKAGIMAQSLPRVCSSFLRVCRRRCNFSSGNPELQNSNSAGSSISREEKINAATFFFPEFPHIWLR